MGAGVAAFLLFQLLAAFPGVTETVYGRAAGPFIASLLSRFSGVVPLSLAELLIAGYLLWLCGSLFVAIGEVRNRDRGLANAIAAGALRLGAHAGIIVAMFYVLWGFHYARVPLEERQAWNGREADIEELARLAGEMVEAANFEYSGITRSDDLGEPTQAPQRDDLLEQLYAGWERADGVFGISGAAVVGFAPPKSLVASPILDRLQTSGFYFPWTAEANFNGGSPQVSMPQVIAHEMSHQRGFAREDEANFAGYLAASFSPDPYPRYSAYVFAQRQLLAALARYDRDRAAELAGQRLPGVQRDIDAAREHWAQFEGRTSRAARSMNNAYLRSQRVPGGILSYQRSVELLIAYARSRGGWLVRQ
jgi:hypothetical protein